MDRIAAIGSRDAVLLFSAVGIDTFFETDENRVPTLLRRLAGEGYAALYVTESVYELCGEVIEEFKAMPYPAIIPIPDSSGSRGIGMTVLKRNVEKAVGVDVLGNR